MISWGALRLSEAKQLNSYMAGVFIQTKARWQSAHRSEREVEEVLPTGQSKALRQPKVIYSMVSCSLFASPGIPKDWQAELAFLKPHFKKVN